MQQSTSVQPLDDAELDRLGEFLANAGEDAMSLEGMDGYFAALICGPVPSDPLEVIPTVWGEDQVFENEAQATAITDLLLRHWQCMAAALDESLRDEQAMYWPLMLEDEDGNATGNEWAMGFVEGMAVHEDAWESAIEDEESAQMLVPILALAYEHDPDPDMRGTPIDDAAREELLEWLPVSLAELHAWFAEDRLPPVAQVRRDGPKTGRNDPCPCGSGRKYKQCCGGGTE